MRPSFGWDDVTSLAENAQNDIFLDTTGNLATVTGLAQCQQSCNACMEVVLGECVLDLQRGNPYDQAMWSRYIPRAFETVARRNLSAVQEVVSVLVFTITRTANVASYEAEMQTTFGQSVKVSGVIPNV